MTVVVTALAALFLWTGVCSAAVPDTDGPAERRIDTVNGRYTVRQKFTYDTRLLKKKARESVYGRVTTGEGERPVATPGAGRWNSEVHAVINPVDTSNIILFSMEPEGASVYTSLDFGRTWQRTLTIPGGGDPVLAADTDGALYAVYLGHAPDGSEPRTVRYHVSTDKGATWTAPENNRADRGTEVTDETDKEWVAIDRSNSPYRGTVYVIYGVVPAEGNESQYLVVTKKRPGQATFAEKPVRITLPGFSFYAFGSIDVDHNGNVHVVFWGNRWGDAVSGLWHIASYDGGTTFSQARRVAGLASSIDEMFDNVEKYVIPGGTIGPTSLLAVDRSEGPHRGTLYVVWDDVALADGVPSSTVWITRSVDGGATWSAKQAVSPAPSAPRRYHFYPSITTSPSGAVCVSWYDGGEAEGNTSVRTSMVTSFDGGATFSPVIPVSSSPADLPALTQKDGLAFSVGHYMQIVATGGYAIPFWSDGRSGMSFDLYCGFIPLSPTATTVERVESVAEESGIRAVFPNPAQEVVTVSLRIARSAQVSLCLTDAAGHVVRPVFSGALDGGTHSLRFAVSDLPAGVYFCTATVNGRNTQAWPLVRR